MSAKCNLIIYVHLKKKFFMKNKLNVFILYACNAVNGIHLHLNKFYVRVSTNGNINKPGCSKVYYKLHPQLAEHFFLLRKRDVDESGCGGERNPESEYDVIEVIAQAGS